MYNLKFYLEIRERIEPRLFKEKGDGMKSTVFLLLSAVVCSLMLSSLQAMEDVDIFTAVKTGNVARVKDLIENGGVNVNAKNSGGLTPLILAAYRGYDKVVQVLLDNGAAVDAKDKEGWTPLLMAAQNGHDKVVQLLLDKGANIEGLGSIGSTPLILAVALAQDKVVQVLLDNGANLNARTSDGMTVLGAVLVVDTTTNKNITKDKKVAMTKLLFDKTIGNNKKNVIPQKSCWVSFSTAENDWNDSVMLGLVAALEGKIIAICRPSFFNKFITDNPFIVNYFLSKQWSLFVENNKDLLVIIPDKVDNAQDYGFTNVTLVSSRDEIEELCSNAPDRDSKQVIESFKNIIDKNKDKHPTRFYLAGHGWRDVIANIPIEDMRNVLSIFVDNDAESLFINSCNAAGQNLITIEDQIKKICKNEYQSVINGKQVIMTGLSNDGLWIAAMLAADANLEGGPGVAPLGVAIFTSNPTPA